MPFLHRNWFMLGLLISMLVGYVFADLLRSIDHAKWLTQLIIATVIFAMALPLEFKEIRRVVRRPSGPLLASWINLGLAPILAWPLSKLLGEELGNGLIVAAATPCTLASATVWTRKAGGNDAVSMMVTLLTNGICFIVTPLWVRLLVSENVAPIPVLPLMIQLILVVLFPIAAAQLLCARSSIRDWTARHKTPLGVYAQLGVLTMVILGISQMTNRLGQVDGPKVTLFLIVACGVITLALHLSLFWCGWLSAARMKLVREDQIAIGFSSSQKTLMVGMSTAIELGLSAIPLITYHLLQLIVDTVLANRLRSRSSEGEKTIVDTAFD